MRLTSTLSPSKLVRIDLFSSLFTFFRLCTGGELFELIIKNEYFTEEVAAKIFK